jgi:hypothetical protein
MEQLRVMKLMDLRINALILQQLSQEINPPELKCVSVHQQRNYSTTRAHVSKRTEHACTPRVVLQSGIHMVGGRE